MPDHRNPDGVTPAACCGELENFLEVFQLIRPLRPEIRIGEVEIYQALIDRARSFAPPTDDVTLVFIKSSGFHRGA